MEELDYDELPTKTYRVENGRIIDFVDSLDAMKQLVEKTLMTEQLEYVIYTEYFGSSFSDLYGMPKSYVTADILRLIKEALLIDERIVSIDNFKIINTNRSSMTIYFEVVTIFGSFFEEREVVFDD